MRRCLVILVLGLSALATAHTPPAVMRQPLILRLDGHFAADGGTARREGADAISIRVGDVERWFAVDSARTMNALATLSGRDVLNALAPFHPTLIAVGDARLRNRLAELPVGTPFRVEGLVDRGSRTYLLRDVANAVPPGPPAP